MNPPAYTRERERLGPLGGESNPGYELRIDPDGDRLNRAGLTLSRWSAVHQKDPSQVTPKLNAENTSSHVSRCVIRSTKYTFNQADVMAADDPDSCRTYTRSSSPEKHSTAWAVPSNRRPLSEDHRPGSDAGGYTWNSLPDVVRVTHTRPPEL